MRQSVLRYRAARSAFLAANLWGGDRIGRIGWRFSMMKMFVALEKRTLISKKREIKAMEQKKQEKRKIEQVKVALNLARTPIEVGSWHKQFGTSFWWRVTSWVVKVPSKENVMGGRGSDTLGGDAMNHCLLWVEATVVAGQKYSANDYWKLHSAWNFRLFPKAGTLLQVYGWEFFYGLASLLAIGGHTTRVGIQV